MLRWLRRGRREEYALVTGAGDKRDTRKTGMHVGLGLCFQNLDRKMSDADVYKLELGLAAEAEGRGFDSVWTP